MPERAIDQKGVQGQLRRLLRRQQAAPGGPWLHAEIARRLAGRLALIRHRPQRVIEWWGSLGASAEVLRAACPDASFRVVEPDADWAALARRQRQAPWWTARRWTAPADEVVVADQPLPPAGADLVFSNMALQAEADPPALFARWHQALAVEGFVMFSGLGPDTGKELRAVYAAAGFGPPSAAFVDMHDLGDMLVHAGFADPVMDQETLTLTWASPAALLGELRGLGGNVAPDRAPGLRTPRWRARLERAMEALRDRDGRLRLSVEVAYGHAFKAAPRPARGDAARVGLEDLRATLPSRRAAPDGTAGLG
ncbi:hypothetical protein [Piscinibacter sakaiensis]|uniref:SAM-dependent methyltransferase, BioC-like n=1 Tax=Piscinibacter sakaiensis TaxID=1547922 RepID=A0A0K8P122_PISS1|nr:hypothetical protein [Piscinibacter sakaiensis]GAP36331.1 SAM-dependent methyltransferase, BioC-like [Piscinibacter sakaiensis]